MLAVIDNCYELMMKEEKTLSPKVYTRIFHLEAVIEFLKSNHIHCRYLFDFLSYDTLCTDIELRTEIRPRRDTPI